jgi:predicted dehydrogenase
VRVAIFGSGFGLYGYLPALTEASEGNVILPGRYRAGFESRSELRHLFNRIEWVEDENVALDRADAVILSQRPADQVSWLAKILPRSGPGRILLEKPLAPDPVQAQLWLGRARASGKRIRIGYIFRYAPWATRFAESLKPSQANGEIAISWRFRAHHYATETMNWKRFVASGGGALRFYGIHLIALLAEHGYDDVLRSSITTTKSDEAEAWEAAFTGPELPICKVTVDSAAVDACFSIAADTSANPFVALGGPFDEVERLARFDSRVGILVRLCTDLLTSDITLPAWYEDSMILWSKVEQRTEMIWPRRGKN